VRVGAQYSRWHNERLFKDALINQTWAA
jgi:hypothetical protein